jgi:hypothetical protein
MNTTPGGNLEEIRNWALKMHLNAGISLALLRFGNIFSDDLWFKHRKALATVPLEVLRELKEGLERAESPQAAMDLIVKTLSDFGYSENG